MTIRGLGASTLCPSEEGVELSGDEGPRTNRAGEPTWRSRLAQLGRKPSNINFDDPDGSRKALPAPQQSESVISQRPNTMAAGIDLLDATGPSQSRDSSFNRRDGSETSSFNRSFKSMNERLTDVLQEGDFPDAPVSPDHVLQSAPGRCGSLTSIRSSSSNCRGRLEVGQSVSTGGSLNELLETLSEHPAAAAAERRPAEGSIPPPDASAPSQSTQATVPGTAVETEDLKTWLAKRAHVHPKFIDAVMATCDEQMVGYVEDLARLQRAGMLPSVFKPAIAASIEEGLGGGSHQAQHLREQPVVSAV